MKRLRHFFRRDTEHSVEGRSWSSKPFAGTLAAIAATTVTFAVLYFWFDKERSLETLRLSLVFLGYLLLLDIIKVFKKK